MKVVNIILGLFGRHICDYKYSDLELFQGYPYFHHYTKRICWRCGRKQEWIPILDQEGGVTGGTWRDIK